jgi:hypothetical protein
MALPIQRTTLDRAPFKLERVRRARVAAVYPDSGSGISWTNYTIATNIGGEVLIELLPSGRPGYPNNITCFPRAPICGSGGDDDDGGGLCPSVGCASQLYAMMGDCNFNACVFGISSGSKKNVTLLIGVSHGAEVTYVRVDLPL